MATSGQWQTSSQFSQGQEGREERLGKRTHRDSQMVLSAICYCGGNGAMPRPVRFRSIGGAFTCVWGVPCTRVSYSFLFIVILRIFRTSWRPVRPHVRPRSVCCPFPGGVCQLDTHAGWAGRGSDVRTCHHQHHEHDVAPCTDARRQRVVISSAHAHVPWFDARLPPNDSNK